MSLFNANNKLNLQILLENENWAEINISYDLKESIKNTIGLDEKIKI